MVQKSAGARKRYEAAADAKFKGGIDNRTPMAFVVMDAQEKYFLIGVKEAPYPIVEITKGLSPDANVNDIKVTFSRKKSLIPCSL